jgi:hypothetical protein
MLKNQSDLRNFKGGAWDLRKDDRRKEQRPLSFPDRRQTPRRITELVSSQSDLIGLVSWVDKSGFNE